MSIQQGGVRISVVNEGGKEGAIGILVFASILPGVLERNNEETISGWPRHHKQGVGNFTEKPAQIEGDC